MADELTRQAFIARAICLHNHPTGCECAATQTPPAPPQPPTPADTAQTRCRRSLTKWMLFGLTRRGRCAAPNYYSGPRPHFGPAPKSPGPAIHCIAWNAASALWWPIARRLSRLLCALDAPSPEAAPACSAQRASHLAAKDKSQTAPARHADTSGPHAPASHQSSSSAEPIDW
jgi:hypothetical protein